MQRERETEGRKRQAWTNSWRGVREEREGMAIFAVRCGKGGSE